MGETELPTVLSSKNRMPTLNWASKSCLSPEPASLKTESVVYPRGVGYSADSPASNDEAYDRLILGENFAVMSALLPTHEGKIDLIYADPPFFTQRRYPARIGRGEDSRRPQEWQLAEGYPDSWPNLEAYLDMLYPRLRLMQRLLSPTGTLYLHLDWHANAYARVLLDEIFGADRLLNEIVWLYHGPSPIRTAFNRKHDTLLVYTKSERYTFNADAVRQPYHPVTVKTFASSPKAGFGKVPNLARGKVPEDWWYFPVVARLHNERTGYPTQKPEALLERILLASSKPGDLVADFFCGSGTTAVVAARLGRRFIANDASWRAVLTTQLRLVANGVSPFRVETLEKENSRSIVTRWVEKSALDLQSAALDLSPLLAENHLPTEPELVYWEVDPAWDGHLFRSALQALRPRLKNQAIARRLTLPFAPEEHPLCVRTVDSQGKITCYIVE